MYDKRKLLQEAKLAEGLPAGNGNSESHIVEKAGLETSISTRADTAAEKLDKEGGQAPASTSAPATGASLFSTFAASSASPFAVTAGGATSFGFGHTSGAANGGTGTGFGECGLCYPPETYWLSSPLQDLVAVLEPGTTPLWGGTESKGFSFATAGTSGTGFSFPATSTIGTFGTGKSA